MDKRIIFAVAGSGKTTHIVDGLSHDKRSLIITYTNSNYDNLRKKIANKFDGDWPENITLMTYFSFLYSFCYKPFLSDMHKAKGVLYEPNPNRFARQDNLNYYMTEKRYLYSNRLSLLMEKSGVIGEVKMRISKYFDEFIIDEIQDISGRDFVFLEHLMTIDTNMLFVGDFYQHTFDTSKDGNINKSLFSNKATYQARFTSKGFTIDDTTLINSWRCSPSVCTYIRDFLDIPMYSNRSNDDDTLIEFVSDSGLIRSIVEEIGIIKLHYNNGAKYGAGHKNWGDSKGEDHHQDACVLLNRTTLSKYTDGKLCELAPLTKNKFYVAITRARGNVYFVDESCI
ncbi:AAA family ATPase [Ruminococcaceae bacterium OttesenSCG-928-N02]|nr:AAA family ATPase [Ruminococcaceae bacterium OttesenSCG-928-N02]